MALDVGKWNPKEYYKMAEECGGEEEMLARWPDDPEISERLGVTYEETASGYEKLLEDITKTNQEIFPNREVWVQAFGHSGSIEAGLATYAKKTSRQFMEASGNRVIETMNSAHITIKPDGQRKIVYRGREF